MPVEELVVAGGLLKNPFLMQIYADVTAPRRCSLIDSEQGPALGSAIHAAVAAGAYPDIERGGGGDGQASGATPTRPTPAAPTPTTSSTRSTRRCTTTSAAAANDVMHRLRGASPRRAVASMSDDIRRLRARGVRRCTPELPRNGLVAWTSGNVSARVPGEELMVIKASGVSFDELTPEAWSSATSTAASSRATSRRPATPPRTPTSTASMPHVGGIVHTHSAYATAWAARGEAIPCVLTAMADEFGGEIPIGPFALIGGEEIGRGIVDDARRHRSPAVLMRSHGVFTIGRDRARRHQGRGDVRGRRPHRAPRPRARHAHPARRRGDRRAL